MLLSGCTLSQNAHRTLILEPRAHFWKSDRKRSLETYAYWAEEAWAVEQHHPAAHGAGVEYGRGFRDGFVDYVYAGGTGEPPPIPPRRFWNIERRSAAGHAAAQDWFAGYRHGARVAHEGGFRHQATLQSSLLAGADAPGYFLPGDLPAAPWVPIDDDEVLPLPGLLVPDELDEAEPLVPLLELPLMSAIGPPRPQPVPDEDDDGPAPQTVLLAAASAAVTTTATTTTTDDERLRPEPDTPAAVGQTAVELAAMPPPVSKASIPERPLQRIVVDCRQEVPPLGEQIAWQPAAVGPTGRPAPPSSTLRVLGSPPQIPAPSTRTSNRAPAPRSQRQPAAAAASIRFLHASDAPEPPP